MLGQVRVRHCAVLCGAAVSDATDRASLCSVFRSAVTRKEFFNLLQGRAGGNGWQW